VDKGRQSQAEAVRRGDSGHISATKKKTQRGFKKELYIGPGGIGKDNRKKKEPKGTKKEQEKNIYHRKKKKPKQRQEKNNTNCLSCITER
jgi:hypothetical protein